jgi:hypothetical protein
MANISWEFSLGACLGVSTYIGIILITIIYIHVSHDKSRTPFSEKAGGINAKGWVFCQEEEEGGARRWTMMQSSGGPGTRWRRKAAFMDNSETKMPTCGGEL